MQIEATYAISAAPEFTPSERQIDIGRHGPYTILPLRCAQCILSVSASAGRVMALAIHTATNMMYIIGRMWVYNPTPVKRKIFIWEKMEKNGKKWKKNMIKI